MAKKQNKPTVADTTPKEKKPMPQVAYSAPVSDNPVADFFENLGNKAWLVASGLILLVAIIVFRGYIFADKVYQFKDIGSDTLNGLYPYMYYTAGQFSLHHLPEWSFNQGIGQNMFPLLFHDPFDIFLFLGGKDHLTYHIIFKEVAKILFGGTAFFFYLRTMKLSNFTSIFGSLLFSFCSFMIVGGGWYYHSFEAFNVAILLLAFEKLFLEKKWLLFPIAIFLTSASVPFDLYLYGLFLALYAIVRSYQCNVLNLKDTGTLFLKMIGFGAIGMLVSAPLLIQNIFMMLESPRGNGGTSLASTLSATPMFTTADNNMLGTSIMRFFSSDILGSGIEFKGWGNLIEAPMFYCGIPCLLLMPQVFQFLEKKVKIVFGIFLAIWLLPVIFPYFRYAFWLFAGDYFRAYSFFVALVFMYFSVVAFDSIVKKHKINLVVLIITVVGLLILLNLPLLPDRGIINTAILSCAVLLVFVYAILLFFMGRQGSPSYLKYVFMAVLVVELIYMTNITVNDRDAVTSAELSQRIGYNDYTVEAVSFIKSHDSSFYRIDKNYGSTPAIHSSLNDGLIQGYYGTSSYSSFNQGKYINYLELMGIVDKTNENQTRWAMGLISKPILEAENRVKYILAKKSINPLWNVVCDSIGTFGDVRVFKNKFVLPVGYTYDHYIKGSTFSLLSSVQRDFVSLRACVVDDKDITKVQGLAEFQLKDTIPPAAFSIDLLKQYVTELAADTLKVQRFDEKEISGTIDLNQDKVMYMSIPDDGGWRLKVNDLPTEKMILNSGITGIFLKKGHNKVELTFHQRYWELSELMTLGGLLLFAGLMVYDFMKRRKSIIS